ncbi:PAAR domain-containing protein [Tenacibaculum maritimum]|uniref:PAAR domain-containing protein n=1 Tax=Tenacibaculum maritimum TaxID=107401 RepID=UPI0012E4F011|nr:PAAR domain-containing protein [Tenacibaculum maritimum]CAA0242685.1 PAAR repeat-containing protein [Tenacibaculum maritimum]
MPGKAATIGHEHTCPMYSGSKAHKGGGIIGQGVPTVLIGNKPAAVMGDKCSCQGPPDTIVEGCSTVLIGGKPAVTQGDKTAHGGVVSEGNTTVLIGTGTQVPKAIKAIEEIPFPKIGFGTKVLAAVSGNGEKITAAKKEQEKIKRAFLNEGHLGNFSLSL